MEGLGPRVELWGSRRAVVDGCDGVVEYGDSQVALRAGRLLVVFRGRDLRLARLTENAAVIQGRLESVSYGCPDRRGEAAP